MLNTLLTQLGIELPIIQAPMAGTSTAALAAAVSNAGGLGSLGLGNCNVEQAREQIQQLKRATAKPFNANFFCHQPAIADAQREQEWLTMLQPYFAEFDTQPPSQLHAGNPSFIDNPAMLEMLLEERPAVVSFHFGLPSAACIQALKQAGIKLLASATNLAEAQAIAAAGLDAVIAQGHEAGGHRGVFNPEQDSKLGLFSLLQLLNNQCTLPIIAAGGIMHGQAIAQVMNMGASAAQLGTAFILCPESAAPQAYRDQLKSNRAYTTDVTTVISGRPARGLVNRFHTDIATQHTQLPAYPTTYSAGKALHAAASQHGCDDFAPYWAGQAAPLAREMPATELVALLATEWTHDSLHSFYKRAHMIYQIHPIQAQHDADICQIIQQVGAQYGAVGEGFGPADAEVLCMSQHYLTEQRSQYLVATIAGKVVGGAGIAPFLHYSDICELKKLFLAPSSQGLGIGKALTQACLAFAVEQGYQQCYLDTLSSMHAAINLYEQLGFTHLSQPLTGTLHGGCDVWMLKDLPA